MKEKLMILLKHLILFVIGGASYVGIELAFRGYSHWSMFIVGGLCFLMVGAVNEVLDWDTPFWLQCLIADLAVTATEFISGVILNKILNLHVWDYSNMPGNLWGLICPQFFVAWFFLCGIGILYDDYVRYWFFGEEKPRYNWGLARSNGGR